VTKLEAKSPAAGRSDGRVAGGGGPACRLPPGGWAIVILAYVLGGWCLPGGAWGGNAASVIRLELFPQSGQVVLLHRGRSLALYEFRPAPQKPCLSLFCSIEGINVLEDTTTDHPFVRGLGLGFDINGVSFSQEGSGWQKSGPEITRRVQRDAHGRPVAELSHTVFWVPARSTPAMRESAWLIEERRLRFVIDEPARETAVDWHSDFEVGPAADQVTLSAPAGSGLTLRLIPDFRPRHPPRTEMPESDTAERDTEKVSPAGWSAMTADIAGRRLTVTCFDDPAPPAQSGFRVQTEPFTMITASHGLDDQPWVGRPGDRFRLQALVTVLTREVTGPMLDERRGQWLKQ
jgi:hypothetical protein